MDAFFVAAIVHRAFIWDGGHHRLRIHHFLFAELLRHYACIEEGIQSHLPVLVDELEAHNTPTKLQIGKGKTFTKNTVTIHATHGHATAQTFGVHLLEEHGIQIVDHVPRSLACNAVLGTQTISEGQFVLVNRNVLSPQEGV